MEMQQSATIRREPSIPTLHAVDLNWLIGQYISWQRTQIDQKTVDCYACKVKWFTEWWEVTGPTKDWLLRQSDLEAFERHLRDVQSKRTRRKLSWNSRNDVLRQLREMFHWAFNKHHTDRDYAQWIPRADGGPPKRRAVGITALIKLLTVAAVSSQAIRDKAILAVMMGMGLRRIEVYHLNVEDVTIEADYSGYARVVGKRTIANATGERYAAFDAATGKLLAAHLDACGHSSGPLFRNPQEERLSTQGIYRVTKAMIEAAGVEKEVQACHDLRRAFATYSARHRKGTDNADRRRRQLGHAKFSQTAEYELLDVEDLREDFISPLGAMNEGILGIDPY